MDIRMLDSRYHRLFAAFATELDIAENEIRRLNEELELVAATNSDTIADLRAEANDYDTTIAAMAGRIAELENLAARSANLDPPTASILYDITTLVFPRYAKGETIEPTQLLETLRVKLADLDELTRAAQRAAEFRSTIREIAGCDAHEATTDAVIIDSVRDLAEKARRLAMLRTATAPTTDSPETTNGTKE
ncbi:MAG: hypothetical protein AB7R77_12770 [Ilumatobacteraceae bacterium]